MDETPLLRVGETLGRFEITGVVAGGGMGEVYRARDSQLQRDVAIKLLRRSDPHDLDRFKREAETGARFSHANIVNVFDVGTHHQGDRAFPYLVMQFIEGQSLRERMGARKDDLVRWLSEVADGLAALHRRGVVHRDIKPENIMIGTDDRARIVDFGLAKTDGTTVTTEGTIVGTVDYLSPEQAAGHRLNYRSDLFSFGIVLYEALTGQHPFRAATVPETLRRIYHEPPPVWIPDTLGAIAARCLKKDPKDRYDDTADLARDLREQVTSPPRGDTPRSAATPSADATTARMVPLQVAATVAKPVVYRAWMVVFVAVLLAGAIALYKQASLPREARHPQVNTAPSAPSAQRTSMLPACALSGSPGTINFGESARLNWSSTNAVDTVISPAIGLVGANGSIDVSPRVTTTYHFVVTSANGIVAESSITLLVVNAPADFQITPATGSITASPATISRQGEAATLRWNSFDATHVVITPSIGIVPLSGSIQVAPPVTTTYTMTINNDTGDSAGRASATVYVEPAGINPTGVVANPDLFIDCTTATQPGVTGTTVMDSTSCSVPAHRTVTHAMLNYTLDDAGTISINARSVFTKPPGVGAREGTLTLPVDLFAPGKSFSVKVEARNAVNPDGTSVGEVYGKAVVHLVTRDAMAGVEMGVTPSVIRQGETAILDWSSVDATTLILNPLVGMVEPKGSITVSPRQTTTYTLRGWSASGDPATGHVTLEVR